MTTRPTVRSALLLALALVLGPPGPGCSSQPSFDPAAQYSPKSLAEEFLFRFKGLNLKAKRSTAASKKGRGKPDKEKEGQVAAKSQETAKKPPASTLDDLLDEMAAKARKLPGSNPRQTLTEASEYVSRAVTVPENDRKILAERIKERADQE